MSEMVHFPNVSYVEGNVQIHLDLSRYTERFEKAQQWLGDRVLEDCRRFMPLQTGNSIQRSYTTSGGARVVFPGPYMRFLYMGKVMIDPDTGSPFARRGVKKVVTDRLLTYSRASATDHWFDAAKAQFGKNWIDGAKKILLGGEVE